jgi:hypothetical protein
MPEPVETATASLQFERRASGVLLVQLSGDWLKDGKGLTLLRQSLN